MYDIKIPHLIIFANSVSEEFRQSSVTMVSVSRNVANKTDIDGDLGAFIFKDFYTDISGTWGEMAQSRAYAA